MTRRPLTAWFALALTASLARAQGAPPSAESLMRASAAPVTAAAGSRVEVVVDLAILEHWHVNANPPALDYNIPTEVSLAKRRGLTPGRAIYPAGKSQTFSFEDTPLLVYDGTASVRIPVAIASDATNGAHTLEGKVAFQACNDQVCLPPQSVAFTATVTVTGGAEPGAAPPPEASAPDTGTSRAPPPDTAAAAVTPPPPAAGDFSTAPPPGGSAAQQNRLQDALARGGLWWFLALFVGGLLLNLTPCVFPMLGITVSIFGARRNVPLPQVLLQAVVYVLGIAVMYSALGVIAALTGGLFGAALQNPLVNIGLGLLLMVLALSMFGFYELQAPGWVLDRLGGGGNTSLAGTFLSGLGVGVVAAPCVGPFVVAVLALIAQKGSAAFGFQTMFVMALGLGLPYLFLAAFSNLLQTLPRSGEWMDWVKKVFGVLLSAIGLFYVLIGLAPRATPWVLPAALLLGGLYLGFMEKSGNSKAGFKRFKSLVGLGAVIAGVALVLALVRTSGKGVVFQPYDESALAVTRAAGRMAMLDFSADWCVPCHELEHATFTDRRVVASLAGMDRYKVDLTKYDSPDAERWRKQYGITGVPTLVFLRPDGREVTAARVEGFIPPDAFLQRVALAVP